jgi:ABC-2 type transport system permease protein
MMRNIFTLVVNDLLISVKNKSLFLILFIPLFAVLSLKLVDQTGANFQSMKIGIMRNESYPAAIVKTVKSADEIFTVSQVLDMEEGKKLLKEKKLDGILLNSETDKGRLDLLVIREESFQTLAIVAGFTGLQRSAEGGSPNWISKIRSVHEGGVQKQALPTWVLMSVLLVGFIIIPAQVAEEKEKKLLLGLLQTPMREFEWLLAKLFLGMILSFTAVSLLHLMGGFGLGRGLSYVLFVMVGSFCFSSFGIFLGFLCGNQASARTLGVIFYLPFLFPAALSDFSQKLSAVAPILPSYQFYGPIRSILLEGGGASMFSLEWAYLFVVGLALLFLSGRLMKKRWLM